MDSSDDDTQTAIAFMAHITAQQHHTSKLLTASNTVAQAYHERQEDDESDDETDSKRFLGRGYTRYTKNATYKITHLTASVFDTLHSIVEPKLSKPFNVLGRFEENEQRVARRRKFDTQELLFILFDMLGGSNEKGQGLEHMALRYGCSIASLSNYFRHALFALYKSLDALCPKLVRWPNEEERQRMEGLIIGFQSCVFFVDGNKNRRWRPKEDGEQERAYDGYKKAHCFALLVFWDLFGRFIRFEITDHETESDRNLYTGSEVHRNRALYLSNGQYGMADMGFAGEGEIVVPYKCNESTSWFYRAQHNKEIRKQKMVNEWGIGFINNRYRLFFGRWPFESDLFPIAYRTAVMVSNWQFERRGYALQTREGILLSLTGSIESKANDTVDFRAALRALRARESPSLRSPTAPFAADLARAQSAQRRATGRMYSRLPPPHRRSHAAC